MRNFIIAIILINGFNIYSQCKCDSTLIEEIINIQLKYADNWFERPYTLKASSTPYDTTKVYYKLNSTYSTYVCGKNLNWDQFNLKSKFCLKETDSINNDEYSIYISSPMFNEEMNKCKIIINSRYSEWRSAAYIFYYRKRRNKWQVNKTSLLYVGS